MDKDKGKKEEEKESGSDKEDDDDPDDGGRTYTAAEFQKVQKEAADRRVQLRSVKEELETLKKESAKNAGLLAKLTSLFSGDDKDADPEKAFEKRNAEIEGQLSKAKKALLKSSLIESLAKSGATKIEDAVALAMYRGDLDGIEVDLDKGTVTGLDEVIESLRKDRGDYWGGDETKRAKGAAQINAKGSEGSGASGYSAVIAKMSVGQREAASRMAKANGWTEDFALRKAAYLHTLGTETPLPEPKPEATT